MEDILASIRRIIADDQSLPSHAVREQTLRGSLPPLVPPPAAEIRPVHRLHSESPSAPIMEPPKSAAVELPKASEPVVASPAAREAGAASPAVGAGAMSDAQPVVASPSVASKAAPELKFTPEPKPAPEPRITAPSQPPAASVPPPVEDEPQVYDAPLGRAPVEAASLVSKATDKSVASAFSMLAATRLADNSDDLLDLARDMIRPMLKTWLDDNLPSMVERLVRAEIERVSRGGR